MNTFPIPKQNSIIMNSTNELASYIQYKDFTLANRRLLDLCYDANNPKQLQQAIQLSKQFHKEGATQAWLQDYEKLSNSLTEVAVQQSTTLLKATEVSKTYGLQNFTLHPVNLEINTGNIIGIVGENGNGKTTLLRTLAGQLMINKGNVHYNLLQQQNHYNIKTHIAFIPQRIPKWHGKLKDNLHYSASVMNITGAENDLMVDFVLERFNLSSYADLTWDQISSGYRTRFEIARIILQRPQLLILDEPLANLDINAQQTLLTDLKMLAKSNRQSMGIILSSQQLHEVEKVADQVMFLSKGKYIYNEANTTVAENKVQIVEIESSASRQQISDAIGQNIAIQFNGGFYTISSKTQSVKEILQAILNNDIPIVYFRDITNSTKKYFNN
jgi:ABC-2 type transport system ATP-binding protein